MAAVTPDEALDARIARECTEQDVPFHIEDEAVLSLVAGLLAAEPAREGGAAA